VTGDTGESDTQAASTAVLVSSQEAADAFAGRGFDPHFVFLESDLMQFVLV